MFSVELEPADGGPVAHALPGQFVTLRLPAEASHTPLLQSYSLSGSSDNPVTGSVSSRNRTAQPAATCESTSRQANHTGGRAAGSLHPPVRLPPDHAAQCRDRRHAGAGNAARPHRAGLGTAVRWVYGARNMMSTPLPARLDLLRVLSDGHLYVAYSHPSPGDRAGACFDMAGWLSVDACVGSPSLAKPTSTCATPSPSCRI